MRNNSYRSIMAISIIIIPILFSCAFAQQIQSESEDADFYFERGLVYMIKGQYDQAISDYTKSLEVNPNFRRAYQAYHNRGRIYMAKGEYDQAISDFAKSLEINPNFALAYYNRGRAYYYKKEKEYDKSWDDIKKAQDLGYKLPPEFLEELRKASGRQN